MGASQAGETRAYAEGRGKAGSARNESQAPHASEPEAYVSIANTLWSYLGGTAEIKQAVQPKNPEVQDWRLQFYNPASRWGAEKKTTPAQEWSQAEGAVAARQL